jgi:hypothetical protein
MTPEQAFATIADICTRYFQVAGAMVGPLQITDQAKNAGEALNIVGQTIDAHRACPEPPELRSVEQSEVSPLPAE